MYLFIYFFFLILGNINWNQVLAAGRPTLQNLKKKKKKKKSGLGPKQFRPYV
jgi:hypothetical protein